MDEQYITHSTLQLPAQLSTNAPAVDWVYNFIFWVSVVFFVAIMVAMTYFLVKYRRANGAKSKPPGHANTLELVWTFGPVILLVLMFHWGFQAYISSAVASDDAYNVRVRGRQWAWQFEHPNGATEDNVLHVPAGRQVRLIMSSSDVLHSFYIPEFRMKRDLVPGMFTTIAFTAVNREDQQAVNPDTGEVLATTAEQVAAEIDPRRVWYTVQVFCAEYCGAGGGWGDNMGHATMYAKLHVMHPRDFDSWVANPPPPMCGDHECSPSEWGEQLFSSKGCTACHGREAGVALAGPNFHGLFGRTETLTDGSQVTVDEAYVRRSILEPRAQIVQNFNPVMPNIPMSEQQLNALVAYLQTL
jgi:cytochrome c oxidase subunit II